MQRKTDAEMARQATAKAVRTLVRLKHSLKADQEINDALPDTLSEFDEALSKGELKNVVASLEDVTRS